MTCHVFCISKGSVNFQLFEGMKAYRGVDGRIRIFRPDMNMERMNKSAIRAGLPTFHGRELIKCLSRLVSIDQEWVPHSESSSLYIRPTFIGIDVSAIAYSPIFSPFICRSCNFTSENYLLLGELWICCVSVIAVEWARVHVGHHPMNMEMRRWLCQI